MRILQLIKALGRGGAEVLLAESLKVANRAQYDFSYLTLLSDPSDMVEDLQELGARVESLGLDPTTGVVLGPFRLARYLEEEGIDLVHAHLPLAGVVARMAGRMARRPVIYTEHSLPQRYHPITLRLNRLTWRWQAAVVAISDDVATSARKYAGDRIPLVTVWNGVNTSHFDPALVSGTATRASLGIPRDVPVVGTVAVLRDNPVKGLSEWLEAARKIREVQPSAHFLLVGDGPLRISLQETAERLGIEEVTHFVGKQRDVRPYLAAMDVFMISSAFEGFGIAPVEAMAMGLPVVGTNVEGLRNVIAPGETGLLATFDAQVASGLASLAVSLVRDPIRRREMGIAGRRVAVERFSIQEMQRKLEDLYDEVLARRRS